MSEVSKLTHLDVRGHARMVEVTQKAVTERSATAEGWIEVGEAVMAAVTAGDAPKGDVLGVARIAGIMAAKRTSDLIPLCHPLPLSGCTVDFTLDRLRGRIRAVCTVHTAGRTGVEMEAITGVSMALTTLYDMCKAISKSMVITGIRLLEKTGGKSGHYRAEVKAAPPVVAVCGVKNSGKTTFLAGLIPALTARGIRVAVLKHDGHDFVPDTPGTDSCRLLMAGASPVGLYSPAHFQLAGVWPQSEPGRLIDWIDRTGMADLILIEGGKALPVPKIELVRAGVSDHPVSEGGERLAICTDLPLTLPEDLPVWGLTDYARAADWLCGWMEVKR